MDGSWSPPLGGSLAHPTGWWPVCRPRTHVGDYTSCLAWKCLRILQEEQESVAGGHLEYSTYPAATATWLWMVCGGDQCYSKSTLIHAWILSLLQKKISAQKLKLNKKKLKGFSLSYSTGHSQKMLNIFLQSFRHMSDLLHQNPSRRWDLKHHLTYWTAVMHGELQITAFC